MIPWKRSTISEIPCGEVEGATQLEQGSDPMVLLYLPATHAVQL